MKLPVLLLLLVSLPAFAQDADVVAAPSDDWQAAPPPPPSAQELEDESEDEAPPLVQAEPPAAAQTQQNFDAALSAYGQWVNDETAGRVWQPNPEQVGADF